MISLDRPTMIFSRFIYVYTVYFHPFQRYALSIVGTDRMPISTANGRPIGLSEMTVTPILLRSVQVSCLSFTVKKSFEIIDLAGRFGI